MDTSPAEIIKQLNSYANPKNVKGMARFGINPNKTLGISIYTLRPIAKKIGKNHALALKLWSSGIHEARILACYIDEADKVTEKQMETWIADFDSWDVCDQVISNLFDQTPFAYKKAFEWSKRKEEFVKRSGFVLMAALSVHDKKATDSKLMKFFPAIVREAPDERNFVRKAVNWALRQIGKRNENLKKEAIKLVKEILKTYPNSKSARWIANDAYHELIKRKFK
jgi:3-methyladenine DNA glycosylase AlkD